MYPTFTDFVKLTQDCPPVVKVARLAVLRNFALYFQFFSAKNRHI